MKKVKFQFDIPEWAFAFLYILGCVVFGTIFGAIVGFLTY